MSAGKPVRRNLFGGAIIADIPELFIDASDIRPVPSEQEVFVSATAATDISIVIDVLERVDGKIEDEEEEEEEEVQPNPSLRRSDDYLEDLEACRIHFEDIIDGREGSVGELFHVGSLQGAETKYGLGIPIYSIKGTVSSPYSPAPPRDDPNYASAQQTLPYSLILAVLFRLGHENTDLLVTVNCPVTSQQDIMLEQRVWHPAYDAPPGDEQEPPSESQVVSDAITLAQQVVASLEIIDWGLFLPKE